MALEFEKLSTHLKEVLLNLKHMSPMQRFNEVSKPRFELQWHTVAFRYGCEKLERQAWMIPDQEILNATPQPEPTTNSPRRHGDTEKTGASGKQGPKSTTSPLINTDCTDQKQGTDLPQRAQSAAIGTSGYRDIRPSEKQTQNLPRGHGDTEEIGVSGDRVIGRSENQNPKANTLPLIDTDCADQKQGTDLPQRAQRAEEIGGSGDPVTSTPARQHRPRRGPRVIGGSESQNPVPVAAESIPQEQLNRLYSGDDRRYVERPEVQEERQRSIEMAARIAAGDTQLNGRWQVLRDKEVLQPEIRAEIEERGGADAIPVNEDFVLARDGRVMYRTTLQWALERELRDRLGVPEPWETDQKKILWHKEQLARLEKADAAPRCEHIYSDGTTCQAPRLRTARWCYAHERMKNVRTKKLILLPTEDANSIMLNLGDIGRALINDEISEKKAGLLMYNQQLGLIALSRVTFKETDGRLMVREAPEVQEHLPQRAQRTRIRIARNAKSAKKSKLEEKTLPLIHGEPHGTPGQVNADGTDQVDEGLEPIVDAGSRSAAAEPTPHLRPMSVNATAALPASVRGDASPLAGEEGTQAGVPVPHEPSNPGVELAKSNGFGVDGGRQGATNLLPKFPKLPTLAIENRQQESPTSTSSHDIADIGKQKHEPNLEGPGRRLVPRPEGAEEKNKCIDPSTSPSLAAHRSCFAQDDRH